MTFDLITFGETLVRLSPEGARTIEQATELNVYPAGSELNVAVAARRLGLSVSYVSKLANNPLGRFVVNKCREQGVDTTWIGWSNEDRQGLYFFENGSPPRPGMAYYDRADSAFSRVSQDDFDWEKILLNTRVFLTSGINPALSSPANEVTFEAVTTARRLGKVVAFDVNYRNKLWDADQAAKTLKGYLPYVDILFVSGGDAANILGFRETPSEEMAAKIANAFGISTVCLIYGIEGQTNSLWRIACCSKEQIYVVDQQGTLLTVDRLGAGDAFAGGFLTGFLESGPELGLTMGNAMMTLKNTYNGDFTWVTREAIEAYMTGGNEMLIR